MKNSSRREDGAKAIKEERKRKRELWKRSLEQAKAAISDMSPEEEEEWGQLTPSWIDQEQIWTGGSGKEPDSGPQARREGRLDRVKKILAERGRVYGPSQTLYGMLAERWSSLTGAKISPSTVVMMLIDMKMCRIINGRGSEDTIDDIIGYAVLMGELGGKD